MNAGGLEFSSFALATPESGSGIIEYRQVVLSPGFPHRDCAAQQRPFLLSPRQDREGERLRKTSTRGACACGRASEGMRPGWGYLLLGINKSRFHLAEFASRMGNPRAWMTWRFVRGG